MRKTLIIFWEAAMHDEPHDDLRNEHRTRLKHLLTRMTISRTKVLYRLFYPEGDLSRSREELAAIVLKSLCFENQDAFDEWFATLTETERIIIRKLTFYKTFPAAPLEHETGEQLVIIEKDRYRTYVKLDPEIRLKFLTVLVTHDVFVIEMPEIMQVALKPFLEPPECHDPNGSIPNGKTLVFDNAGNFSGLFGLLYEALANRNVLQAGPSQNPFKFSKKETQALYHESGFPHFPESDFPLPDSLVLAATFILCQDNPRSSWKGGDRARDMIQRFFNPFHPDKRSYYYYAGSYVEGLLIGSYLKKRTYPNFEVTLEQPVLRHIFFEFLSSIANRETPAPIDEAFSSILNQGVFLFSEVSLCSYFRLKASSLTVDGVTYRSVDNELIPDSTLVLELVTKPLFRAYCFVFAAFGCLELTVAEPPFNATLNGKNIPVSPYDCLCAVRLTEFGKWCLGFTDKKPDEGAQNFEIIADPSLFYVTLRGESIERRIFLDKIGTKIGTERWAISAASFLNGCVGKADINERVKKFRALVAENPAEHWEDFFFRLRKNAGILEEKTGDFLVYHFSPDKETRAALLGDTDFRRVARFAEENLLVVAKGDRQKFFAALANRGISVFATPHRQDGSPH
ncbi:MAG: hypothetical protein LBT00_14395 [Spirochaetaceae bacterium]|jgi:hypothetical protein|nr:hypothetical protein [Spirochaetaceae bacterium]